MTNYLFILGKLSEPYTKVAASAKNESEDCIYNHWWIRSGPKDTFSF